MESVTPNKEKAKALLKMAEITLERLETTDTEKYPSNTLLDYYDAIHKLLEAIAASKGLKFRGEGAHAELIDFISKTELDEHSRALLQQMRDYRNRISYEGFSLNRNYITLNTGKINGIVSRLRQKLQS